MKKVAIIGAGISGLSAAHFLKDKYDVRIFEKNSCPGGMIRCQEVEGSLFHMCGGHVFNSKKQRVLDWFWKYFQKDDEFTKAERNSVVIMDDSHYIPYPIENHVYLFENEFQEHFISDLIGIACQNYSKASNFEEFLKQRFGNTLYETYFKPYNEKIWRRPLNEVPISWLEGKLPMPSVEEMIFNNMNHIEEKTFVHSSFWYEKKSGSQFLADKLAEGLNIQYSSTINSLSYDKDSKKWKIAGEYFDKVLFCANIKDMVKMIAGVDLSSFEKEVASLGYHGTTSVFCEIDTNPYSWIYLPSSDYESHRIICTGNFAKSNNNPAMPKGRISATVEFTDEISKDDILANLRKMPLHPKYIAQVYNQYTYPIQDINTRNLISHLKKELSQYGFYFSGRFADWEYYNMDICIDAAMNVVNSMN